MGRSQQLLVGFVAIAVVAAAAPAVRAQQACNVGEYIIANLKRKQMGVGVPPGSCVPPTTACDATTPKPLFAKQGDDVATNCCPTCYQDGQCRTLEDFEVARLRREGAQCFEPDTVCEHQTAPTLSGAHNCCFDCKVGVETFFKDCSKANRDACEAGYPTLKRCETFDLPQWDKCCPVCKWPPAPKCTAAQLRAAAEEWKTLRACGDGESPAWQPDECKMNCRLQQIATLADNAAKWKEAGCTAAKFFECRKQMPVCSEGSGGKLCDLVAGQCCCSCREPWGALKLADALDCWRKAPACRLDLGERPAALAGGARCPTCKLAAPPADACSPACDSAGEVCGWRLDISDGSFTATCRARATLDFSIANVAAEWRAKLDAFDGAQLTAFVSSAVDAFCEKADALPQCADDDVVAAAKAAVATWVDKAKHQFELVIAKVERAAAGAGGDRKRQSSSSSSDSEQLVRAALADDVATDGNVAATASGSGAAAVSASLATIAVAVAAAVGVLAF